jgi:N-acetylmuramoyl-L-alanine amidase
MLDPGHGGKDPGASGEGKAREKNVVLALSKRLARKLEAHLPVEVLFTRRRDIFIPLEERTARANAAGADLFISLHINASDNPQARGIETYYLNNSNDRATTRLAALENGLQHLASAAPQQTGLSYILSDLIQTGKEEESISLANHLQNALVSRAKKRNPRVRNIGVKKGPFYVLVGAHMPCVLVEAGFITHTVERRLLLSKTYQDDLAEGLYRGIANFLREQEQAKSL